MAWSRRGRVLVSLVVVTLVAAGCVSCSSSGDEDSSEPTPWQREVSNLEPDGSRSLESALRLFAMAIGPIPGAPALPRATELVDATPAIATLLAHEEELTPEQRAAVNAALQPPEDAISFTIPPVAEGTASPPSDGGGGGGRSRHFAAAPPSDRLIRAISTTVTLARQQIAGRIGYDFTGPQTVFLGNAGAGNYAITVGDFDQTGQNGCRVVVNLDLAGPNILAHVLYHETFHCFQNAALPSRGAANGAYANNAWTWEGGAVWAVDDLLGPDVNTPSSWQSWLTTPKRPLFSHAYDAIGFFAHLAETGTSPWTVFRAIYSSVSADAAFAAAGATRDSFLDSWASGYLRDRRLGRAWDFTGKSITGHRVSPSSVSIGKQESRSFSVDPYTNEQLRLAVSADVLDVQVRGHGRLADGKRDYVLKGGAQFCTNGECKCPEEKQGPQKLASESTFALTGGVFGTNVTVTGRDFDEQSCKKKKAKATPRPGRNLGVVVHRPSAPAGGGVIIQELDVMEFAACGGIHGRWVGVVRTGGWGGGGIDAAVSEQRVEFTVDARGHAEVHTRLPAPIDITFRQSVVDVSVDLTINVHGRRMDIIGNYYADLNPVNLPIRRGVSVSC